EEERPGQRRRERRPEMNAREKMLLFVFLGVLAVVVGFFGVKIWWYDSFVEYNAKIAELTKEVTETDEQLEIFQKERKKLTLARMKSLPPKEQEAAAEYMAYLNPLLSKSGLTVDELYKSPATKVKPVTAVGNIKETGHQMMTFTVRAHGELAQLVKALEQM